MEIEIEDLLRGGSKSALTWAQTARWCEAHPEKKAGIMTPRGMFTIIFTPKPAPESLTGIDHG